MAGSLREFLSKRRAACLVAGIAVIAYIAAAMVAAPLINNAHVERHEGVTIVWKERVTYGRVWQRHMYLVFARGEDGGHMVFQDTDSYLRGKLNSSDVYARLEIGTVWDLTAVGRRVRLLSWYPNIVSAEPAD
jgi:hypothetical protein